MGSCVSSPLAQLNLDGSLEEVAEQIRERPSLITQPQPAAFLGLNETALHFAAEKNNVPLLKFILEFLEGADMLTQRAALQPLLRRLRVPPPVLTSDTLHITVNALNNKGQTPLMIACFHSAPEVVKMLLDKGADPWAADRCGRRNALHYAAMSDSAACVEALMKNIRPHMLVRSSVRYINSNSLAGLTALHYAVFYDHEACLRELLRHAPAITAATTSDSYDLWVSCETLSTPLHFAAIKNNTVAARLLLLEYARRRRTGTVLDPRLRNDAAGQLPWQVARTRVLATMLHPAGTLAEALGPDGAAELAAAEAAAEEAGRLGPPALAALAAAALRHKLLSAVEVIQRELVEAAEAARAEAKRRRRGLLPMLLCGAGGAPGCNGLPHMPSMAGLRRLSRTSATSGRSRRRGRSHARAGAAGAQPPEAARTVSPTRRRSGASSPIDAPASPRRAAVFDGEQPHPHPPPELAYAGSMYDGLLDLATTSPPPSVIGDQVPHVPAPGAHTLSGRASLRAGANGGVAAGPSAAASGGGAAAGRSRSGHPRSNRPGSGRPGGQQQHQQASALQRQKSARVSGTSGDGSGGGGGKGGKGGILSMISSGLSSMVSGGGGGGTGAGGAVGGVSRDRPRNRERVAGAIHATSSQALPTTSAPISHAGGSTYGGGDSGGLNSALVGGPGALSARGGASGHPGPGSPGARQSGLGFSAHSGAGITAATAPLTAAVTTPGGHHMVASSSLLPGATGGSSMDGTPQGGSLNGGSLDGGAGSLLNGSSTMNGGSLNGGSLANGGSLNGGSLDGGSLQGGSFTGDTGPTGFLAAAIGAAAGGGFIAYLPEEALSPAPSAPPDDTGTNGNGTGNSVAHASLSGSTLDGSAAGGSNGDGARGAAAAPAKAGLESKPGLLLPTRLPPVKGLGAAFASVAGVTGLAGPAAAQQQPQQQPRQQAGVSGLQSQRSLSGGVPAAATSASGHDSVTSGAGVSPPAGINSSWGPNARSLRPLPGRGVSPSRAAPYAADSTAPIAATAAAAAAGSPHEHNSHAHAYAHNHTPRLDQDPSPFAALSTVVEDHLGEARPSPLPGAPLQLSPLPPSQQQQQQRPSRQPSRKSQEQLSGIGGAVPNGPPVVIMTPSPSLTRGAIASPFAAASAAAAAYSPLRGGGGTVSGPGGGAGGATAEIGFHGGGGGGVVDGSMYPETIPGGSSDGDVYDSEDEDGEGDDDEGMCAVCFSRREAVAPAGCRHGLCTACAAELCRAVTTKPLLCPFCRQPVSDFVRVVPAPPVELTRAGSLRKST